MARIKIKDLPRDRKISKEEMKKVMGGAEMTEMQQLLLQTNMSKQQQALQLMSNISKMLHDTSKTIINNLRG